MRAGFSWATKLPIYPRNTSSPLSKPLKLLVSNSYQTMGRVLVSTYEKQPETMSEEAPLDDQVRRLVKRTPEIEIVIGARLRALRIAAGMSQGTLGEVIGVSFQQIQKYEKGKDRVAASTLQVLAAALKVHPGSFFDGEMPSPVGDVPDVRTALKGAAGLQRISNAKIRIHLETLIDTLADDPGLRTAVSSRTEESEP